MRIRFAFLFTLLVASAAFAGTPALMTPVTHRGHLAIQTNSVGDNVQVMSLDTEVLATANEFSLPNGNVAQANDLEKDSNESFVRRMSIVPAVATSFIRVHEGAVRGVIYGTDGIYEVGGTSRYTEVTKINPTSYSVTACGGTVTPPVTISSTPLLDRLESLASASRGRRRIVGPKSYELTVMLVYDARTLAANGGDAGMQAKLLARVDQWNTATRDSNKSNVREKLVFTALVNPPGGPESFTASQALDWLSKDPGVASLRLAHGAAIVGYVGYVNSYGFTPVKLSQYRPDMGLFTSNDNPMFDLGFIHENGHVYGMNHDLRSVTVKEGDEFLFARAYVAPDGSYATAMQNSIGGSKTIPLFSNPYGNWKGQPVGSAELNNASMLEIGAERISQYPQVLVQQLVSNP